LVTALNPPYDALLVIGFGGPEKMADVLPFLENVLRGKNVPRQRMLEVAAHYTHFEGKSPLNDQMRDLIAKLRVELVAHSIDLPIYWGNRNWHPLLTDTLREMACQGIKRSLAYVASAFSSYSGCQQYLQDIERARQAVGETAPRVDKLRVFYNHPRFIAANSARLCEALESLPSARRQSAHVAFTAHSIPAAMAANCQYAAQLADACRQTARAANISQARWQLAYQSRSGRREDPWLGPDIADHLRDLRARGTSDVIVMPIGFLSDHMEVLYDLDCEARHVADELGLSMIRASTVGTHPQFVSMVRELVEERLSGDSRRAASGAFPAWPDVCPADCCPITPAPSSRSV
jgi:ferrochelatase